LYNSDIPAGSAIDIEEKTPWDKVDQIFQLAQKPASIMAGEIL